MKENVSGTSHRFLRFFFYNKSTDCQSRDKLKKEAGERQKHVTGETTEKRELSQVCVHVCVVVCS